MDLKKLSEPFEPDDVEWRIQRQFGARASVLAYVTNRAIMNRLDAVCGIANWRNEFRDISGGMMCGISILTTYENGGIEWVTKWDGANPSDIEPVKGVISDSMKRAAVQWGIGRYLYKLENSYVDLSETKSTGSRMTKGDDKRTNLYWLPPQLPSWALPKKKASPGVELSERILKYGFADPEEVIKLVRHISNKPKIGTDDYIRANALTDGELAKYIKQYREVKDS